MYSYYNCTLFEQIKMVNTVMKNSQISKVDFTWKPNPQYEDKPVNFETITTSSVRTQVLQDRIYDYNDEPDVALAEIYDFFKGYGEIKIGVYVYEGPVDMEGDINISEFSVEKVIIFEDTTYTGPNSCFTMWVPMMIIIIIPFGIISKLS